MLLPGCQISRPCFFLAVLAASVVAYPVPEDDKTFNLKIGFDLTHGDNGAPSLRIRDFEESREYHPRAGEEKKKDSKEHDKKPAIRADSESGEDEKEDETPKVADKKASSEESKSKSSEKEKSPAPPPPPKASGQSDDDDADGDSDLDTKHSTRALGVGDYEPEEKSPKIHVPQIDDESRRSKRSVRISPLKRKSKKALLFRKMMNANVNKPH